MRTRKECALPLRSQAKNGARAVTDELMGTDSKEDSIKEYGEAEIQAELNRLDGWEEEVNSLPRICTLQYRAGVNCWSRKKARLRFCRHQRFLACRDRLFAPGVHWGAKGEVNQHFTRSSSEIVCRTKMCRWAWRASITRRDFLGSALLASGSALLAGITPAELLAQDDDFTGYGGVGDYSNANGNTLAVLEAGHAIRDRVYDPLPKDVIDTGEIYDCVIIGGGISGLAAALFFQRSAGPGMKCLIVENHPSSAARRSKMSFWLKASD